MVHLDALHVYGMKGSLIDLVIILTVTLSVRREGWWENQVSSEATSLFFSGGSFVT